MSIKKIIYGIGIAALASGIGILVYDYPLYKQLEKERHGYKLTLDDLIIYQQTVLTSHMTVGNTNFDMREVFENPYEQQLKKTREREEVLLEGSIILRYLLK